MWTGVALRQVEPVASLGGVLYYDLVELAEYLFRASQTVAELGSLLQHLPYLLAPLAREISAASLQDLVHR